MKTALFVLLFLLLCRPAGLFSQTDEEEFPDLNFFLGQYTLIGKALDSDSTFLGTLSLSLDEDKRPVFERRTASVVIRGSWDLEFALGNELRVIRLRWVHDGKRLECTYQWCMDFDVYPRLSGHCYESGVGTDHPGMEIAFPLHSYEE
jgi:hypothetical protein